MSTLDNLAIEEKLNCLDKSLDFVLESIKIVSVPIVVYQNSELRHEKKEKKYFRIIYLLGFLLFATNAFWFLSTLFS